MAFFPELAVTLHDINHGNVLNDSKCLICSWGSERAGPQKFKQGVDTEPQPQLWVQVEYLHRRIILCHMALCKVCESSEMQPAQHIDCQGWSVLLSAYLQVLGYQMT